MEPEIRRKLDRLLLRERLQEIFGRMTVYFLWFVAGAFFGCLWMAKAFGNF